MTQNQSSELKNEPQSKRWQRWLPLAILGLIVAIIAFSGAYRVLSFEALVENYQQLKTFIADNFIAAIVLFAVVYVVAVALSFPAAWVLTIAGGIFFGWWLAGITTIIAATIGASVLFWVASSSLGEQLRGNAQGFVQRLRKGMQEDAISYMLFLRLVPAFPFTLINIVPAILGVPFSTFFWTTLVGITPGTLAYSYAGEGLASVVEAQAETFSKCIAEQASDCGVSLSPSDLITAEMLIAFVLLGLVSLLPILIKRFRAKRAPST